MNGRVAAIAIFVVGVGVLAASFLIKGRGTENAPAGPSLLPAGFFLAAEPPGAVSVEDAKKTAKMGDTVILRGRVGGSKSPFVDGRAMVTLVGRGIPACTDIPGHHCPTPWDYCHEPRKTIGEHSATVQVVDGAGGVLKESLSGAQGIKGLSELVVVGKVSQTEGDTLVVDATAVYIAAK